MVTGWFAMWVIAPLVLAGLLIVVITRRRGRRPGLTRVEEWIVGLTGTGALLLFALGAIGLFSATSVFSSNPTVVRDFPIANAEVPEFTKKAAAIVDAGYESAWLSVSGLPTSTRWLLYAETALPTLAMMAICVAVFWLAIMLLRGRPFVRSLTQVTGSTAIVIMIAGVGAQVFASAARASVVEYLDPQIITAGGNETDPAYEGLMGWMLNLDLAPVGWALGLALVAAAFELGQRLQKDTERLV